MLRMEYFSLNFGEAVAIPTVTSAGMREGRAAPGAVAEPKFNEKIWQIQHIKRPQ